MNRLAWIVTAAAIGASLVLLVTLTRTSGDLETGSDGARRDRVTAPGAEPSRQALSPAPQGLPVSVAERPLSLSGTEADGALSVDEFGRFLPSPDVLAFFDYFLTATGEWSEAELRSHIAGEIRRRLSDSASAQAEALLDRYLDFRASVRDLVSSGVPPHDLERRWQWIRELRREHFGAEMAATLFGEAEQVVQVDLERWRESEDGSLSPEERVQRLESMDARLPQTIFEARERVMAPLRSHREVAALRQAGASTEEVRSARAKEFGSDAADRLAELDVARELWWERMADYDQERAALWATMIEAERPSTERNVALQALLDRHFEPSERLRARSLESALR